MYSWRITLSASVLQVEETVNRYLGLDHHITSMGDVREVRSLLIAPSIKNSLFRSKVRSEKRLAGARRWNPDIQGVFFLHDHRRVLLQS